MWYENGKSSFTVSWIESVSSIQIVIEAHARTRTRMNKNNVLSCANLIFVITAGNSLETQIKYIVPFDIL